MYRHLLHLLTVLLFLSGGGVLTGGVLSANAQGRNPPAYPAMPTYPVGQEMHEGKEEFRITAGALGGTEGLLIAGMVNAENPLTYGGFLVGGASTGFLAALLATHGTSVSLGQSAFTLNGGIQGLIHGRSLASLVLGDPVSGDKAAIYAGLFSAAEAVGGYYAARRWRLTPALSGMMFYYGIQGYFTGMLVSSYAFGSASFDNRERAATAIALSGSLVGNAVGYLLTTTGNYTRDDARIIGGMGILGMEAALFPMMALGAGGTKWIAGITAAGTAAGLAAGSYLTRNRNFSSGRGYEFLAGLVLGTGAGFAVTTALSTEASFDEANPLMLVPLIGALVGGGIIFFSYGDTPHSARETAVRTSMRPTRTGRVRTEKVPTGTVKISIRPTLLQPIRADGRSELITSGSQPRAPTHTGLQLQVRF